LTKEAAYEVSKMAAPPPAYNPEYAVAVPVAQAVPVQNYQQQVRLKLFACLFPFVLVQF
jgi:hypothetical protein